MRIKLSILITLLATLALAAIAFWWSPLNQDEGWYLMAARRVSQGQMPYRDFAFTQAPLFPYVFQFAQPLIKTFGLAGGRLFQFFWLGMTFWAILWNCKKHVAKESFPFAALVVLSLLGLNVFQMQYTATVKTYTLAGYFLSLSMLGWLSYQNNPKKGILIYCALALAAATATRLSLGLFFIPLGCSLMHSAKQQKNFHWLAFAGAGLFGLLCFFGPFVLSAPENVKFGLFDFHAGRQVNAPLLLKAGFLSRVVQSYFPAIIATLLLLTKWKTWQPGIKSLGVGILAVTVLHLLAPFPYDDYQAALYPTLVLLIAIEGGHQLSKAKQLHIAPLLLSTCLLFAFSSPQLSGWFSYGQDRIWWITKPQSDLSLLRDKAKALHQTFMEPISKIFTMDSYLAIESGLEIPNSLEMGPFSYFPEMNTEKAVRLHVVNRERMIALIRNSDADVATFSGYTFAIESPWITRTSTEQQKMYFNLMKEKFEPVTVFEHFGQGYTQLVLFADPDLKLRLP